MTGVQTSTSNAHLGWSSSRDSAEVSPLLGWGSVALSCRHRPGPVCGVLGHGGEEGRHLFTHGLR
jgi:hypothetical protein